MQHASYKALCASPAVQADFLEKVATLLESIPTQGENWMRRQALAKIEVGGQPFSISKYLATLEMSSQDWDIDEDDVQLHRFVGAAKTMAVVHPDLNVPHFTFGFHAMPGADTPAPAPKRHLENGSVAGHIIGTPGLGASVLSGAARTAVNVQVQDEGARRVMRPR
jgi:hypothetical protein